ncbi:unnamed protein product [Caenorhabditis sp. 36 PRJEB53466]|nr:unnamed protein product [Caenorhabditis sp. 36 PRJEB53466]
MEVVAAVGAIASVPIIYRAIRPRLKSSVECWFCHMSTKVNYNDRNSFTCPSCEQYNGFNEDGDYNRRIPGQSYTAPKQYCERVREQKRTEGFLDRFNGVNMSPKAANGLCSECNLGQEIIMKKVAEFEAVDEERWNEELEDFRYKLERTHQLCPRCTIQVHGKLEEDKRKYSYLLNMRQQLKHALGSTLKEVMRSSKKKSRRFFFAGGTICESLHIASFVSLIFLFLATIDFLQQDAGCLLISFPKILQDQLPAIYSSSFAINVFTFFAHLIAVYNNMCRVTLTDLLLPIALTFSLLTSLIPMDNLTQDMAVIKCGCASFATILSFTVTMVPRKKLHKKRPNKILSSAFSVASTPISQCSSQNSRNVSLLDDIAVLNRSRQSPQHRTPSATPPFSRSSPNLLRDVTNTTSWSNRAFLEDKENSYMEAMEWEDSESVAQSTRTFQSHFRPGLLSRSRGAQTPQQLAPSVASMSIVGSARPFGSPTTPSIFSRQRRQMMHEQAQPSPARSRFGPPRSMVAPTLERNHYMPETNTRSGSVFTSVSQQDGHSTASGAWQCRVLGVLFALIFIVLIMQIALFYYLFTRNH